MVRLKVGSENSLALFALFQFHYGSIKSLLAAWKVKIWYLFQFHYGSIKSDFEVIEQLIDVEFQFHYGSIKIKYGFQKYRL